MESADESKSGFKANVNNSLLILTYLLFHGQVRLGVLRKSTFSTCNNP